MDARKIIGDISVIEKPEWVSWEEIKQCLFDAHAANRENGINMTHYQWPTDRIIKTLGDNGRMFVALDGEKLAGVAAVCDKTGDSWYAKGKYAYLGFAGVRPEYKGQGIYNELVSVRENHALMHGFNTIIFDTHQRNKVVQNKALKNGYRYVHFFRASSKDHYCVIMAKWPDGCPYSKLYCFYKYIISVIKTLLMTKMLHR